MNEDKLQEIEKLIDNNLDLAPDNEDEYGTGCYIIGKDKAAKAIYQWHQSQLPAPPELTEEQIDKEISEFFKSQANNGKSVMYDIGVSDGYRACLLKFAIKSEPVEETTIDAMLDKLAEYADLPFSTLTCDE